MNAREDPHQTALHDVMWMEPTCQDPGTSTALLPKSEKGGHRNPPGKRVAWELLALASVCLRFSKAFKEIK